MQNRIRECRVAKGMTQRQLAEAAGTSQQQIQRIEAGVQATRFDLATRICAALGLTLQEAFPATALPIARMKKARGERGADQFVQGLEDAGLDTDVRVWTFKYRLQSGAEGQLTITGKSRKYITSAIRQETYSGFIVFDAGNRRYGLRPDHLTFCQFLFDGPASLEAMDEEDSSGSYVLRFHLANGIEPLEFDVAPDTASVDADDPDEGVAQLQDLFLFADSEFGGWFDFRDEDDERAMVRMKDVSMFSVPLEAVEPALLTAAEEDLYD